MESTLNQDYRWFKVGEEIFAENRRGLQKLRQIKKVGINQTIRLFDSFLSTREPFLTWGEFKAIGIEKYKINGFKNLPFEDDTIIRDMLIKEKEQIAGEMPVNGWEHFVDHYTEDEERKQIKSSISNSWQLERTPTEKLVSLIFEKSPDCTLGNFFNACKECDYNETLKDLKKIINMFFEETRCLENALLLKEIINKNRKL